MRKENAELLIDQPLRGEDTELRLRLKEFYVHVPILVYPKEQYKRNGTKIIEIMKWSILSDALEIFYNAMISLHILQTWMKPSSSMEVCVDFSFVPN